MPSFDVSKGDRIRVTVEMYVTYNAGGWIGLTASPVDEDSDSDIQICEAWVVGEPMRSGEYPDGTLFSRLFDTGQTQFTEIWSYYWNHSEQRARWSRITQEPATTSIQPADIKRLYTEDEV